MRVLGFWRVAAALPCAALLPAPAATQTTDEIIKVRDATPEEEIVVEGKAMARPEEVKKQARSMTRMDDFHSEPLAQIQDKVCPGVLGLSREIAEMIVDRMRYNAERVGLDLAKPGQCQPNILVAFVLNGQREVKELARTKGYVFSNISVRELEELTEDAGPVHAWNTTVKRSRDGRPVLGREEDGQIPTVQVPMADSHITLAIRLDTAQSVVVIDIKAIDGMSVVQLADYASMRAFARTRPVIGDSAASTILSLFDRNVAAPRELTAFDVGYLNSIYSTDGNLPASAKIGAVPKEIRKELARASVPKDMP